MKNVCFCNCLTNYLRVCGVECRSNGDLVLGARGYVEGSLAHDRHVEMMHYGNLQALATLIIVSIIK